jgi:hypothetical protein
MSERQAEYRISSRRQRGQKREPYRAKRPDAVELLKLLAYVARHSGVTANELCEVVGASDSTVRRLIRTARQYYGVVIEWHWDRSMPTNGEFLILDWGVFDETRVRRFVRNTG